MEVNFTADFFKNNRQRLRESLNNGAPIILAANGQVQRSGDTAYSFRQDSNFWYLTGIENPDILLVMTKNSEFLIIPKRSTMLDIFEGSLDEAALADISGIKTLYAPQEGWEKLRAIIAKHPTVYTSLYKGFDERHSLYINPAKSRLVSQLKKLHTDVRLVEIRPYLARLRMYKQPLEIAALRRAVNITTAVFKHILESGWFKSGLTEALLEAEFTYEFRKNGTVHAYQPIVAGGRRACTLHYNSNSAPLKRDELLLVDAGAEFSHYSADITRTVAAKKRSSRQQAVWQAVAEAHQHAHSLIKPGFFMRDIEMAVEKHIGKSLKRLGLITNFDRSEIRKYYPHAFSHHLGLDTHDAADYELPLEPGMVITVEPGIYIAEEGIGVRLEDDVLVTQNGYEILSADLPVDL